MYTLGVGTLNMRCKSVSVSGRTRKYNRAFGELCRAAASALYIPFAVLCRLFLVIHEFSELLPYPSRLFESIHSSFLSDRIRRRRVRRRTLAYNTELKLRQVRWPREQRRVVA